jgi:hypothetical protein
MKLHICYDKQISEPLYHTVQLNHKGYSSTFNEAALKMMKAK